MIRERKRKLLSVMRGYRILQLQNRTDFVPLLKNQISNTHLNIPHKELSKIIFGAGISKADLIIRQFLMVKIIGLKFNEAVLAAICNPNKKMAYPLPTEWIKILQQKGINVAERKSFILFNLLCLKMVGIGIANGLFLSINSLLKLQVSKISNRIHGIVYFDALLSSNISINPNNKNIINWYLQYKNRLKNVEYIFHSVKNVDNLLLNNVNINFFSTSIVVFSSFKSLVSYLCWIMRSTLVALFSFYRGNWWNVIIFYEASKSSAIRIQNSQYLANQYLFHNSNWLYRPLWTYEAELKGSEIIFYFYSTNTESFAQIGKEFFQSNSWHLVNWPKYLVWDKFQLEFIKRMDANSPVVEVVGSIWFSSSHDDGRINLPKYAVGVFDVQPVRDSFYQTLGAEFNYYVPELANNFINDIYRITSLIGLTLVFKKKRDIGRMAHSSYRYNLKKFENHLDFIFINPNVASFDVIENCCAVISMPFTSTALIAKELGKPSAFYDPLTWIQKNDPAAHGIEILQGEDELLQWLKSTIKDDQVIV